MFRLLRDWSQKRARFSQEWAFHRDQLASRLEAQGLCRLEAQRIARRKMGPKSRWKREALREIGADWFVLVYSADWRRLRSSAWLAPALLILAFALLLICNPWRLQLLESLTSETRDYVPLEKLIVVPADFARLIWGAILVFQIVSLVQARRGWRVYGYALLLFLQLAVFGVAVWITAIQITVAVEWPSDMFEGWCLLALFFTYFWASLSTAKLVRSSVSARCPVCLRRLHSPVARGQSCDLLVNPKEVESICLQGHGTLIESHWRQTFRASAGFWEDLAGADCG